MAAQTISLPLDTGLGQHEYSLVATQETDKFRYLYDLEDCGANLEEVIFEFGVEDTFFTFSLPENFQLAQEEAHRLKSLEPSASENRLFYPSAKFGVIVRPGDKPPVFFFSLCDCRSCKRSLDTDQLNLKSFEMKFQLNFGASPSEVRGPFYPTCKEEYNLGWSLAKNLKNVIHYAEGWTRRFAMRDFIAHLLSVRVPGANDAADITTTIKLRSVAERDPDFDDNHNTLENMLHNHAFADFTLISCHDDQKYKCHRSVLSAQSEELKRIILRKNSKTEPVESRNSLTLTEGGPTIWAFLQWIYCKSESRISSSFEVASGLLRLGHEYHLPKLVAAASQVLTQKVKDDAPNWNIPAALWKFYKFVRLVDKMDVVVRLKMEIVKSLAKKLAKCKFILQNRTSNSMEVINALNQGEPVDPAVASDFIMDVVGLGKF